jgi:hypothetical protein
MSFRGAPPPTPCTAEPPARLSADHTYPNQIIHLINVLSGVPHHKTPCTAEPPARLSADHTYPNQTNHLINVLQGCPSTGLRVQQSLQHCCQLITLIQTKLLQSFQISKEKVVQPYIFYKFNVSN